MGQLVLLTSAAVGMALRTSHCLALIVGSVVNACRIIWSRTLLCVCACMRAYVRVCMLACVRACVIWTTAEPLNNGLIGDRPLVLCREVVPFSEVGVEQICSQTMLCLASLVPRLPRLGAPAPIECSPDHAIGRLLT